MARWRGVARPSLPARSEIITRTTAFRSVPSSASAWSSSSVCRRRGHVDRERDGVPSSRNRRAPSRLPSGLVPNASVPPRRRPAAAIAQRLRGENRAASDAPRSARAGRSAGRAASRPGRARAPRAGTGGGARVTTRGLRQMTTGVTPGLGLTSVNVQIHLRGPGRRSRRAAPAAAAQRPSAYV